VDGSKKKTTGRTFDALFASGNHFLNHYFSSILCDAADSRKLANDDNAKVIGVINGRLEF